MEERTPDVAHRDGGEADGSCGGFAPGVYLALIVLVGHVNTHRCTDHIGGQAVDGGSTGHLEEGAHQRLQQGAEELNDARLEYEYDEPAADGYGGHNSASQGQDLAADLGIGKDSSRRQLEPHSQDHQQGHTVVDLLVGGNIAQIPGTRPRF